MGDGDGDGGMGEPRISQYSKVFTIYQGCYARSKVMASQRARAASDPGKRDEDDEVFAVGVDEAGGPRWRF